MDTRESLSRELQAFGLTPNQAHIYLALLEHGELRVQSIANIANIARTSVYGCIEELSKLGLIEKIIDHTFIRIKPYPLSHLRNRLDEEVVRIEKLKNDLPSLQKKVGLLPHASDSSITLIRYYKGLSGGRQLFYNSLNATNTVYVYSSYGRSTYIGKKFYTNFVKESQEKGIKEKVLINPTKATIDLIKRDTGSSLARTLTQNIRFLSEDSVVIQGETFLYNNIFAQIDLKAEEMNGFEIESSGFLHMQRSIFETLWKTAQTVSELLS